jgi:hypothetical protein
MRTLFVGVLAALLALASLYSPTRASADEGRLGYDISWPQCGKAYPAPPFDFAILGVDGGRAFTKNPCFASEYSWAASSGSLPSLYMTLRQPVGPTAARGLTGPAGDCRPSDVLCLAYNYGFNAAGEAVGYATAHAPVPHSTMWWLDIETVSSWSADSNVNREVISGAIDFFATRGTPVGIYSTSSQWSTITKGMMTRLPTWVAGARNAAEAARYCESSRRSFGGGEIWFVQYVIGDFDHNFRCSAALPLTTMALPAPGDSIVPTQTPTVKVDAPQSGRGTPAAANPLPSQAPTPLTAVEPSTIDPPPQPREARKPGWLERLRELLP